MKWFLRNETKKKIMLAGAICCDYADEIKKYFDSLATEYEFDIVKSEALDADAIISEKTDTVIFFYNDDYEVLIDKFYKNNIKSVLLTPVPDSMKLCSDFEKQAEYIMGLEKDERITCCVDLYEYYKDYLTEQIDVSCEFFRSIASRAVLKALVNVTLTAPVGEFKDGTYHGFERKNFYFAGREATFILPKNFANGKPWCWRGEFLGAFDSADISMLKQGWGLAYINLYDMYGCDEAVDIMHKFHLFLIKEFGICKKTVFFGFSRGGLYSVNYAAKHPEYVSGIYLDAPVVDIYSWPGGFYTGVSNPESRVWKECKLLYNVSDEEKDSYLKLLPKKLDTLLENNIPIMYVAGGSDSVVPYFENGVYIVDEYLKRGGKIKIYIESWRDHHPHSLEEPMEITRFIIDEMSPTL